MRGYLLDLDKKLIHCNDGVVRTADELVRRVGSNLYEGWHGTLVDEVFIGD